MKTPFKIFDKHQFMLLLLCLLSPLFVACGDDDEDFEEGGITTSGDQVYITIDGKEYGGKIPNIYTTIELTDELEATGTTVSPQQFSKGEFYYQIVHHIDLDKLANTPTGNYRMTESATMSFYPDEDNDVRPFDLCVLLDYKDTTFESVSGTNQVTKVTRKGDGVMVEGNYKATLSNENYRDGYEKEERMKVSGRYRMTIFP